MKTAKPHGKNPSIPPRGFLQNDLHTQLISTFVCSTLWRSWFVCDQERFSSIQREVLIDKVARPIKKSEKWFFPSLWPPLFYARGICSRQQPGLPVSLTLKSAEKRIIAQKIRNCHVWMGGGGKCMSFGVSTCSLVRRRPPDWLRPSWHLIIYMNHCAWVENSRGVMRQTHFYLPSGSHLYCPWLIQRRSPRDAAAKL